MKKKKSKEKEMKKMKKKTRTFLIGPFPFFALFPPPVKKTKN